MTINVYDSGLKCDWKEFGYRFRSKDGFGTVWWEDDDTPDATEWRKEVWCDEDGWHYREQHRGLGPGCFYTDWKTEDISYLDAIAEFREWLSD